MTRHKATPGTPSFCFRIDELNDLEHVSTPDDATGLVPAHNVLGAALSYSIVPIQGLNAFRRKNEGAEQLSPFCRSTWCF